MLIDITPENVSVLEGGAFEVASKTTYYRSTGIPAGRYLPDGASVYCTSIDALIESLKDKRKRIAYPHPFITDCLLHEHASYPVDPQSIPVPYGDGYGHICISSSDTTVRVLVRASNLRTALRKVTLTSPEFEAAIIENANGAQALRLSAHIPGVQIVVWLATYGDSLSRWITHEGQ